MLWTQWFIILSYIYTIFYFIIIMKNCFRGIGVIACSGFTRREILYMSALHAIAHCSKKWYSAYKYAEYIRKCRLLVFTYFKVLKSQNNKCKSKLKNIHHKLARADNVLFVVCMFLCRITNKNTKVFKRTINHNLLSFLFIKSNKELKLVYI